MRKRIAKVSALTVGAGLSVILAIGASAGTSQAAVGSATALAASWQGGYCSDPVIGGTFRCEGGDYTSGETWWTFPDGTTQVFVVGTNAAVYTKWSVTGGWSSWTSMGGTVEGATSAPFVSFWDGCFSGSGGGNYTPTIVVFGNNGSGFFVRKRSTSGTWSAWQLDPGITFASCYD